MRHRTVTDDDVEENRQHHERNHRQRSRKAVYAIRTVRRIHREPEDERRARHVDPERRQPDGLEERQPDDHPVCALKSNGIPVDRHIQHSLLRKERRVDQFGVPEEQENGDRNRDDCVQKSLLELAPRHQRPVIEIAEQHRRVQHRHGHDVPEPERRKEENHRQANERHVKSRPCRLACGLHSTEILAQHLAAVARQAVPEPGQQGQRQKRRRERAARQKQGMRLKQTKRSPKLGQILREIVEHFSVGRWQRITSFVSRPHFQTSRRRPSKERAPAPEPFRPAPCAASSPPEVPSLLRAFHCPCRRK